MASLKHICVFVSLFFFFVFSGRASAQLIQDFNPTAEYQVHSNPTYRSITQPAIQTEFTTPLGSSPSQSLHDANAQAPLQSVGFFGKISRWTNQFFTQTIPKTLYSNPVSTFAVRLARKGSQLLHSTLSFGKQAITAAKTEFPKLSSFTLWTPFTMAHPMLSLFTTSLAHPFFTSSVHHGFNALAAATNLGLLTVSALGAGTLALLFHQPLERMKEKNMRWWERHTGWNPQPATNSITTIATTLLLAGSIYVGISAASGIVAGTITAESIATGLSSYLTTQIPRAVQETAQECLQPIQCDTPVNTSVTFGVNLVSQGLPDFEVDQAAIKAKDVVVEEVVSSQNVVFKQTKSVFSSAQIDEISSKIAHGHAFEKHVVSEVNIEGIHSQDSLKSIVQEIITNPDQVKHGRNDRIAFWNNDKQLIVIYDPRSNDFGTIFKPQDQIEYFHRFK